MRHLFGIPLFVAIMLAFQSIEPSSGGEPIGWSLCSRSGRKNWETRFSMRGRWFVPTCKLFNLGFKQLQGTGQIYLGSNEWVALSSHPRQNPILHHMGARLFLTEPASSSSGLFSHWSRSLTLKWMGAVTIRE